MSLLTHYRDVARESAERAWRAPIGWMSPFWLGYGAVVGAGAAWWWMNQLGRPSNLEAAHAAEAAAVETPAPQTQIDATASPEPAVADSPPEIAAERAAAAPEPDDLTRIVGIGPRLSAALAERGVTRFAQMAAWTDAEISEIDAALKLKGGISRHAWVAQARRFAHQDA